MSIMSRLIRVLKADLHGVMDRLEDRHLLLKQYLREMEDALAENRANLEDLRTREGQLACEQAACREKVDALEDDIALAVARDKDDIARLLIRKLHPLRQGAEAFDARAGRLAEEIQTRQANCEWQAQAYARLRQRAASAAAQHRPERRGISSAPIETALWQSAPSAEEIELELLQRKEAQRAGRLS